MQSEPNRRIGDYEILGRLGAGGMGEVYKVRNVISDRVEAMKVLLPSLAGNKHLDDRFLREIKLVASLNHPNIAGLCTACTIDGQFVMVMEFVEGVTIESLIQQGPISVPDTLNYLDQALAALGCAHARGIIHRDIKPANFMLTSNGTVKLMDFGIARADGDRPLTQTGAALGTYDYMPPEQIMGRPTDARSDLYAIGISIYEMVTGQLPYQSDSSYKVMDAHLNQAPRHPVELLPWLPVRLNEIILKLIAKSPDDRFQSAEDLRLALKTVDTRTSGGTVPEARARQTLVSPVPVAAKPRSQSRGGTQPAPDPWMPAEGFQKVTPVVAAPARPLGGPAMWIGATVLVLAVAATATTVVRHNGKSETTPAAPSQPSGVSNSGSNGTPNKPVEVPKPVDQKTAVPVNPQSGRDYMAHPAKPPVGGKEMAANNNVHIVPPPPSPLPSGPTPEEKAELDQIEMNLDQMSSQATGINSSLNTMQHSMQESGVSMRGDVAAHQASMNNSLNKARQALIAHDVDRANRFSTQAQADQAALLKFLGR